MFGVGLAVAVLLDVTLVRMVLVPAAMSLLGHRAWWLPAWLDRLLPTIDLEGGAHATARTEGDAATEGAEPEAEDDAREERACAGRGSLPPLPVHAGRSVPSGTGRPARSRPVPSRRATRAVPGGPYAPIRPGRSTLPGPPGAGSVAGAASGPHDSLHTG